jgi:Icc protein
VSSVASQPPPLRLVQITDCHLGEQPNYRLLDLDTDRSLAAVLQLIAREQPHIDAVVATGDLADRGSAEAYRRFARATATLCAHTALDADEGCRWLPGNHDDWPGIRAALGPAHPRLRRQLLLPGWQVIMLDSTIPGEVGGNLTVSELAALRRCLDAEPERFALICLHHHILPVGAAWLDAQRVANGEQLLAELARHPQVRGVLSGHVHQNSERTLRSDAAGPDGIRLLTSPSTCVQFAANSAEFQIDAQAAPGYRWLDLLADGRIVTGVSRVRDVRFDVDETAVGY